MLADSNSKSTAAKAWATTGDKKPSQRKSEKKEPKANLKYQRGSISFGPWTLSILLRERFRYIRGRDWGRVWVRVPLPLPLPQPLPTSIWMQTSPCVVIFLCAAAKCAAVCRPPPKSRSTLGNPRHLEGNEMKSMQKKFYYAREGKKMRFFIWKIFGTDCGWHGRGLMRMWGGC